MNKDEIIQTLEWLARERRRGRIVTLNPDVAEYLADLVRKSK